jgi:hypothetical protein
VLISKITRGDGSAWPDLDVARWAGTKRSLHLYAQMLGKIKLALAPVAPNWMFTRLFLTSRGVSTGFVPWRDTSFEAAIDVFDSTIVISRSTGARVTIPLVPVRTVAEIYAELTAALETLEIRCEITPLPQEMPDTTRLDRDRRPSEYDPEAVLRWFRASTTTSGIFDAWRATFFGRTGLQVWWGALDVALILFNGRHAKPPANRGYIMKYDLDAELMSVGLYFGDEQHGPFFYGYIYPEPSGAENLPIAPAQASWSSALREWVLPYEVVQQSKNPQATLCAFSDAIYEQCFRTAGWDRDALTYTPPPRP